MNLKNVDIPLFDLEKRLAMNNSKHKIYIQNAFYAIGA